LKKGELPPPVPSLAERIVYQSGRFIVVNKLPGEAVEGAGPGMADLPRLLNAFLKDAEGISEQASGETPIPATAVNRLDVPVSGCALFARTKEALAGAHAQFRNRKVEKHYWAIVEIPTENSTAAKIIAQEKPATPVKLIHWLEEDTQKNRIRAFDEAGPERKRAEMRYDIRGRGDRYLFLEIELITGRRHQIRAQLEKLGFHIKGDLKYGARRSEKNGGIRLHAASLAFYDPPLIRDHKVRTNALPPQMDPLWEAMRLSVETK
jgi:23S rRNA pseudouridine1911/1915/1917 synthase